MSKKSDGFPSFLTITDEKIMFLMEKMTGNDVFCVQMTHILRWIICPYRKNTAPLQQSYHTEKRRKSLQIDISRCIDRTNNR